MKTVVRHAGTALEPKTQRVASTARYCYACDEFMSRRVCKACGLATEKVPSVEREHCTRCDGDGFNSMGGNCPRCIGSGREAAR